MKKLVLDLFSGKGGWTKAFEDNKDWEIIRIDADPKFSDVPFTMIENIIDLDLSVIPRRPDLLLSGPPCERMCVPALRYYWKQAKPVSIPGKAAREHIELFRKTYDIIWALRPRFYVIENPTAMLKHVLGPCDHRTYFCIWLYPEFLKEHGYRPPKKPTDLWYLLPLIVDAGPLIEPEFSWPRLKKGTWELASRGSKKGLQKIKKSEDRAEIPFRLSKFVMELVEEHDRRGLEDPPLNPRYFYDFRDYFTPSTPK